MQAIDFQKVTSFKVPQRPKGLARMAGFPPHENGFGLFFPKLLTGLDDSSPNRHKRSFREKIRYELKCVVASEMSVSTKLLIQKER